MSRRSLLGVEGHLRRIFSGWYLDERAWVVAPLAIWLLAFVVFAVWRMAREKRVLSRRQVARKLGPVWIVTFLAAVVWLVSWSIWLTVAG